MKEPLTRATFTVDLAREYFGYDPTLGRVIRLKNPERGPKVAGQIASTVHKPSGFRRVKFQGLLIYEHHLVWALVNGYWPYTRIKHIDDDTQNNRIDNLCEETNTARTSASVESDGHVTKALQFSGVVKTESGRYKSSIFRGKMHYLGTFDTAEEASQAYISAKKVLHSPLNRGVASEDLL